ncbi:MAG: hypothetical protein NWE93_10210 [Candidatus Bathyarchaeota archaeon]|nr:hypothetical protein [Candidatus Bathyarchaeota archaeon]
MLPDYPILKRKLNRKLEVIIRNEVNKDPLQASIPKKIVHEGDRIAIKSIDGYSSETSYGTFVSDFQITTEEIIQKGPNAVFSRTKEIAKDMTEKMNKHFIGVFEKVTETTGNVVTSKTGITAESILETFEKIEMSFDDSGNPIMPLIIITPQDYDKIKQDLDSKEFREKQKAIIEKKRKGWLDRESNRKLVD